MPPVSESRLVIAGMVSVVKQRYLRWCFGCIAFGLDRGLGSKGTDEGACLQA